MRLLKTEQLGCAVAATLSLRLTLVYADVQKAAATFTRSSRTTVTVANEPQIKTDD